MIINKNENKFLKCNGDNYTNYIYIENLDNLGKLSNKVSTNLQ